MPKDQKSTKESGSPDELVMTSVRISRRQKQAIDIIAQMTGRPKADIVRQALDNHFRYLCSPEWVEAMIQKTREKLLSQTEQLRASLGK